MRAHVRLLSATIAIGAVCGLVIAGLGSRLAMRILFLTSGERVRGVKSDDGFIIGRFTLGDTIGLLIFTTILGVAAAFLYLAAHPFVLSSRLPPVPTMAVFYGVVGGALLVHQGGVDFTEVQPAALAIAMFVAIPAGFGGAVAALVGAAARSDWLQSQSWAVVGPPLVALAFPPFFFFGVFAFLLSQVAVQFRPGSRWRRPLHLAAHVTMALLFVLGAVDLTRDAVALI